jgi:hypothetical protein
MVKPRPSLRPTLDANREKKKKKEKELVVLPKQFHAKLHTKLVPEDCLKR